MGARVPVGMLAFHIGRVTLCDGHHLENPSGIDFGIISLSSVSTNFVLGVMLHFRCDAIFNGDIPAVPLRMGRGLALLGSSTLQRAGDCWV